MRECIAAIMGFVWFHFSQIHPAREACFHRSITSGLVLANGVRQGICCLGYLATKIKDSLLAEILGGFSKNIAAR